MHNTAVITILAMGSNNSALTTGGTSYGSRKSRNTKLRTQPERRCSERSGARPDDSCIGPDVRNRPAEANRFLRFVTGQTSAGFSVLERKLPRSWVQACQSG